MSDLKTGLSEAVAAAFAAAGLPAELGRVTPSDRPDLADFQCNGALPLAKSQGSNPRAIAAAIVAGLAGHPALESAEIAGPPGTSGGPGTLATMHEKPMPISSSGS